MKVGILGGTGFVGNYIIEELIKNNHDPIVFVRNGSENKLQNKTTIINGDLDNNNSLNLLISKSDAIIYNVGIIREFPKSGIAFDNLHHKKLCNVISKCVKQKIKHFILMSANGVENNITQYQSSKLKGENYLIKSGLNWTIIRPSLIFGNPNGGIEFCTQLKKDMIKLPLPAPSFYSGLLPLKAGKFKMSPIHVKNVAEFFSKCINKKSSFNHIYSLGGSKMYTWNELVKIIGISSGYKKWLIPTPVLPIKLIAKCFERFAWFPITCDQITMLMLGNTCDSKKLFDEFNIKELEFNEKNLKYLSCNE
tara:strand:+ start:75 stop:998 length:924 start_codon:yes stop_codon:yes gene_type:complete